MKKLFLIAMATVGIAVGFSQPANAGEWCTVTDARITSNSTSTTLSGTLTGAGSAAKDWLMLDRTESADVVKTRTAIVLAAAMAGKTLLVYVTGSYTCTSVPAWTINVIDHVQTVP